MQRKPTMNDVARLAGVGTMTVSRVLNGSQHVSEETAGRVREAVAQLGYHPNEMARALRNFKTRTVGLLLPNLYDSFYAVCAHSLNMVAKEHGYTVLLTLTNDDSVHEYQEARRMMQRHVEGLIVIPADSRLCRLGEDEFSEIPVVTLDRPIEDGPAVDCVLTENETGGRLGTEHLLATHGLSRILFLGHKAELYTMQRRWDGYASAMRAAGLRPDQNLCCGSEESAVHILEQVFRRSAPPQAIFSANNLTTRHVLFALRRLRIRVPEDIALVGFDELELSDLLHPALTVIRQPAEELGRTAGRLLFSRMRMKKPSAFTPTATAPTVLPLNLVVRHSCGCTYEPEYQQQEVDCLSETL